MGSRNRVPPSAPYTTNVTTFVAVNWVEANSSRGSMGWAAFRCHHTNTASSTDPPTSAPSTAALVQPADGPSMSPYVTPTSPSVTSTPPATSTRPVASGSYDSGTCRHDRYTT